MSTATFERMLEPCIHAVKRYQTLSAPQDARRGHTKAAIQLLFVAHAGLAAPLPIAVSVQDIHAAPESQPLREKGRAQTLASSGAPAKC